MTEGVYHRLRKFLDDLPAGYPETPTGVEIKLLKKMFTPEDAELTMTLSREAESVETIAARTGLNQMDLAEKLEDLALKGLIFRVNDDGVKKYQAFQFLIGLYEFQLNRIDREFSELFEEFLPYFGMSMVPVKTKQLRVIPVDSSLPVKSTVAPYNQIRALVEEQSLMAVAQCLCRKEQGLLGAPCSKPQETCISFGKFAQYYIDNKLARRITREEAFKILDLAEKAGLVLQPTNNQNIDAICCCCSCCCPGLRVAKMVKHPNRIIKSYYYAEIDPGLCTSCGTCIERCQMEAIIEKDEASEIILDRCIGCGLCVSTCPTVAITMKAKFGQDDPPQHFDEVLERIEAERKAV